jgi:hypothetical protein
LEEKGKFREGRGNVNAGAREGRLWWGVGVRVRVRVIRV